MGPVLFSTAPQRCQGKGEAGDSHCSPTGQHSPSVWSCSRTDQNKSPLQARKGVRIWLFISCNVTGMELGTHTAGNHPLCGPEDIGILSGQFLAFQSNT